MLVCNISYPTSQDLANSSASITWTTGLSNVDLSDQSEVVVDGVYLEAVLNIMSVNSSYCGAYSCSALDDRIAQPTIGTATVQVGKMHIPQSRCITNVLLYAHSTFDRH